MGRVGGSWDGGTRRCEQANGGNGGSVGLWAGRAREWTGSAMHRDAVLCAIGAWRMVPVAWSRFLRGGVAVPPFLTAFALDRATGPAELRSSSSMASRGTVTLEAGA